MKVTGISIIIPCRNEEKNLQYLIENINNISNKYEIVLIEGGSTDKTWELCKKIKIIKNQNIQIIKQSTKGKMNAVYEGAKMATFDHIAIWDSDFTVRISDQNRILEHYVLKEGRSFVSGSRLNSKLEFGSMRIINFFGNLFFAIGLSVSLRSSIRDSLCGSKVFPKELLLSPLALDVHMGDPFGDHSLLLEASLRQMPIEFVSIRYRKRMFGKTNIHRFSDGLKLLFLLPKIFLRKKKSLGNL
jgi:glycosyltransferase involved in cell wall biosynthesis